jgi:dTDP-4-amino-4,6-dideoxygalactose transaminase
MLMTLLEDMFEVRRAIPVARGALGLAAVLKVWRGTRQSCKVALPAAICHEVVVAVLAAGCEPLFCDVSVADGLVTDAEWRRARSSGAEVAIVVHLYGNPANTQAVRSLFPAPACLVIDDAAQALGSRSGTGLCGSGGDVGLLSFGPTKHIVAGGAALLFRDAVFAAETQRLVATFEPQPEELRARLAATSARRVASRR